MKITANHWTMQASSEARPINLGFVWNILSAETTEGGLWEVKIEKKFLMGACPRIPPKTLRRRRSVFILDPYLVRVRFANESHIWNLTFALSSLFLWNSTCFLRDSFLAYKINISFTTLSTQSIHSWTACADPFHVPCTICDVIRFNSQRQL